MQASLSHLAALLPSEQRTDTERLLLTKFLQDHPGHQSALPARGRMREGRKRLIYFSPEAGSPRGQPRSFPCERDRMWVPGTQSSGPEAGLAQKGRAAPSALSALGEWGHGRVPAPHIQGHPGQAWLRAHLPYTGPSRSRRTRPSEGSGADRGAPPKPADPALSSLCSMAKPRGHQFPGSACLLKTRKYREATGPFHLAD